MQENFDDDLNLYKGCSVGTSEQPNEMPQSAGERTQVPPEGNPAVPDAAFFDSHSTYGSYVPNGFTKETYEEKNNVKKVARTIGIPLIVSMLIGEFWAKGYYAVMSSFGIEPQEAYRKISEPVVMDIVQTVLSLFMFVVLFAFAAKLSGYRISSITAYEKPQKGTLIPFLLFGFGFCSFANISVSYAGAIFESFGIDYSVNFGQNAKGFWGFLITVLTSAAIPAISEEFACRGVVYGLLKKFGDGFAIIVSAVLFGLLHGNFEQIPFAFLVGIILGLIRAKTGSMWVCMALHFANNFSAVLTDYAAGYLTNAQMSVIYLIMRTVYLLLAVFGVYLLLANKKDANVWKLEPAGTVSKQKDIYKWFFSSAFIIIFIVLSLREAVSYFLR